MASDEDLLPFYEGWLKVDKLYGDTQQDRDFVRLAVDGSLDMHHFCDTCSDNYKELANYHGSGTGARDGIVVDGLATGRGVMPYFNGLIIAFVI